jgi:hypothetical protein
MRIRAALSLVTAALLLSFATPAAPAGGRKILTESLLSVVKPEHKSVAHAHPWVNVEIEFGSTSDGVTADPGTFKARLGGCDITDLFEDFQHGSTAGKHARVPPNLGGACRLKKGSRARNRLKFKIRAQPTGAKGRRSTDLDRVRFGALEVENQAPVPGFTADPPAIGSACTNGGSGSGQTVEVSFSASATDQDGDRLRYDWDFGDGSSGSGPDVVHQYAAENPVTVSLRVSDGDVGQGGREVLVQRSLQSPLSVDTGRSCGTLRLSTNPPSTILDFGVVPVGSSRETRFRLHNDDPAEAATSQVKVSIEVAGEELSSAGHQFSVESCTAAAPCSIDAGETRDVVVTFAPQQAGHAHAVLLLEAAASNRSVAQLLVHGYAGSGPGVPWGTPDTVFGLAGELLAVTPAGITTFLGAGTGFCQGGSLESAPCIVDGDCPGAACSPRVCRGGFNDGASCGAFQECPGGYCGDPFDVLDMCADGNGSVFLLNDEMHDDPNPNCEECDETGTILQVAIDGQQSVVTQKVTFESLAVACDRLSDGRVFWTQHDIYSAQFEEREQLLSVRKSGSGPQIHVDNVNKRLGDVDPANYIDPSDGFIYYEPSIAARVSANGSQRYVANPFGLYRLDPPPALHITREVEEVFDLGTDGSILAALPDSRTNEVRVYKVNPSIALNGAVTLSLTTPWATARVPSNTIPCATPPCPRSIFITNVAGDSAGNVFVNILTVADSEAGSVVPRNLRPQGTLRFAPVGDGSRGTSTGFVSLFLLDRLDL